MSANLAEGAVFAGRYQVVRCLATGAMGAVYEVVHLETDRRRALKVMHPHLFQSEEMRGRFKREARIAAQIDSEYIVDVSDAGVDEATQIPFLVMELLRGEELGVRLARMKRLPPDEVTTYIQQVAWALERTHAASIVHRDLKPENLFLTTRDDGTPRIKILDFGVAKLVAEGATSAGATQSLGTPLYMAPEQFRTNTKLTPAADIHALVQMTYTLLVGEAYWEEEAEGAGDVIAFAVAVMNGPKESAVARAARRGVALPPGFDAWFAKGAALEPGERFATATEAVRALRAVGGTVTATSTGIAAVAATSGTGLSLTGGSSALINGASNSMGASAIPATPAERSRGPLVAIIAVLAVAAAGLGGWLILHPAAHSPVSTTDGAAISALPTAAPAAPAASSAAAIEVVPAVIPASAAPSAAPPEVAVTSKPVGGASSARAPLTAKTAPPPVKKPPPIKTLLGRD